MSFHRRRCTSVNLQPAGSVRFWSRAPVHTLIRQRRSGVKSLFPESIEIGRVRSGGVRALRILSDGKDQVGKERLVGLRDKSLAAFEGLLPRSAYATSSGVNAKT